MHCTIFRWKLKPGIWEEIKVLITIALIWNLHIVFLNTIHYEQGKITADQSSWDLRMRLITVKQVTNRCLAMNKLEVCCRTVCVKRDILYYTGHNMNLGVRSTRREPCGLLKFHHWRRRIWQLIYYLQMF